MQVRISRSVIVALMVFTFFAGGSSASAQVFESICEPAYAQAVVGLQQTALTDAQRILNQRVQMDGTRVFKNAGAAATVGAGLSLLADDFDWRIGATVGATLGTFYAVLTNGFRPIEGEEEAQQVLRTNSELNSVRDVLRAVYVLKNANPDAIASRPITAAYNEVKFFSIFRAEINLYGTHLLAEKVMRGPILETNQCLVALDPNACAEEYSRRLNQIINVISDADSSGLLCQNNDLYSLDQVVDLVRAEF